MNVCTGGRKKKLNASMLATETTTAANEPPDDRDRQHRQQVEHSEAQHRHVVAKQVDGSADRRDQHRADGKPG